MGSWACDGHQEARSLAGAHSLSFFFSLCISLFRNQKWTNRPPTMARSPVSLCSSRASKKQRRPRQAIYPTSGGDRSSSISTCAGALGCAGFCSFSSKRKPAQERGCRGVDLTFEATFVSLPPRSPSKDVDQTLQQAGHVHRGGWLEEQAAASQRRSIQLRRSTGRHVVRRAVRLQRRR